ncbi:acyl-CoA dehydrogenase family protein [Streptomyces sp. T028]|uniref:acyl-CoA dehydrogenase family protein n=1 Tax=Streptomyces sp. T028 TaxID=3394379 RepID=UPI003A859AD5
MTTDTDTDTTDTDTDTADATQVLDRVRAFVRAELLPRAEYFDGLPEQPTVESARMHTAGLANWWIPAAYGGAGVSLQDSVDIVSELAYGDAGFAFGSFLSVLGTVMLQLHGDEAVARPVLERLVQGGGRLGILGSEEDAGSELNRTATTYRRDGDDLVLDGEKYFSTNSEPADTLLVLARSADDDGDYAVVAVPRAAPGVEIIKRWDMLGVRGAGTYRVRLRDCRVPAVGRLRGNGLRLLEIGLNASRILIAATAIGVARRIRDLSMEYAAQKRIKGAPLRENAVFAAKLGQIEMTIDVMRHQCRAAAAEFDRYLAADNPAAALYRVGTLRSALAAKLYCGQAGWQVATTGSEMFGGLGYTHDHPIGKLVRDLRYVAIVEGGDDVMRELIYARYVVPVGKRR